MKKFAKFVLALVASVVIVSCDDSKEKEVESNAAMDFYCSHLEEEGFNLESDTIDTAFPFEKNQQRHTVQLFLNTLEVMGCEGDVEEHSCSTWIYFVFKREHFCAVIEHNSLTVTVIDLPWYSISDIDYIKASKIVNTTNKHFPFTMILSYDEDEKKYDVSTRRNFIFVEEMPCKQEMLTAILKNMIFIQRAFMYSFNEDD